MSQGLKISELPDLPKNDIDVGDYFIIAEKTGQNTWATRKVDAKFILKLKTEAVNAGLDENEAEILASTTTNNETQASVLNFRRLKAGSDISLVQSADNIVINALVNARNEETNIANRAGLFIGKNTNDDLRFKNISGTKGIETVHDNPTRVIIQPMAHHYFFVPARPNNPDINPNILNIWSKQKNQPGALWPGRPLAGAWTTPTQTINLTDQINALPQNVRDSLNAAEKGLAFIRIRLNTNSAGNVPHYVQVKSSGADTWVTKIDIDPTGGSGAAWEGEDTTTTIVQFNKNNRSFDWRVGVGNVARTTAWEFSVGMWLEGFFI